MQQLLIFNFNFTLLTFYFELEWLHASEPRLQPLTFRHRTSVTPYTAPFGLARSCVFDKQSPGVL